MDKYYYYYYQLAIIFRAAVYEIKLTGGRISFISYMHTGTGIAPETMFRSKDYPDVNTQAAQGIYQVAITDSGGLISKNPNTFPLDQRQVHIQPVGAGYAGLLIGNNRAGNQVAKKQGKKEFLHTVKIPENTEETGINI